jgi:DNA-binding CsgD family transcriptional regulator
VLRTDAAKTARSEISRLCADAPAQPVLLQRALELLAPAVPFDAGGFSALDPATLLWTGGVLSSMPAAIAGGFFENELFQDDFLKTKVLRAAPTPAAALSHATGGVMDRSARFRTLYSPNGFGDELRVVFTADGAAWGQGCLLRDAAKGRFTHAEAAFVASLGRHVSHALSVAPAAVEAAPAAPAATAEGPGVLVVDDLARALAVTGDAARWLGELGWREDAEQLPAVVGSVVARARACANGGSDGPPRARVRGASGRWICVHASAWPLGGWSVVLEPARPAEVLPLVCQAHGLTAREQEVLGLMLRGSTDADVAAKLVISDHTAKEHAKAVLRKMGARTRVELQATLFADHYTPWMAEAA